MKRILFLLVTVVITLVTTTIKNQHLQQISLRDTQRTQEQTLKKDTQITVTAAKVAEKPPEIAPAPVAEPLTCRQAIEKVFPTGLQSGAKIVLEHENRSENPIAKGAVNGDGSRDYGCMQINDKAHPQFFATADWSDPVANVTEAYKIYLGRQSAQGNGWRAWYAVQGVLW